MLVLPCKTALLFTLIVVVLPELDTVALPAVTVTLKAETGETEKKKKKNAVEAESNFLRNV